MIPAEVLVPTARYGLLTQERNEVELTHDLDVIDERRDQARKRLAAYQQQVARSYNKNVRIKAFSVGDWVLRKVFPNKQEPNASKLSPMWEGPYIIKEVVGQGAYRLQEQTGAMVPRSWNAVHLKLYHF